MKKHIFYQKYANIPLPHRYLVSSGTIEHEFKDAKSPDELYQEIHDLDNVIARATLRQEELLEIADTILGSNSKKV